MCIHHQYIQRARWFQIVDSNKKTNRYELVYVVDYVDSNGTSKLHNEKYVNIRRMNHKMWKQPMKLKSGLLKIKNYTKIKPQIPLSFSLSDIEWFLRWGMESFLKYSAHVM